MQARLLNRPFCEDINKLMHDIGVDKSGIKIMSPKGRYRLIYLEKIPSFSANILKQESLSAGADVALPKEALIKKKLIDCILIASDAQIGRITKKLKNQPYSLNRIGSLITGTIKKFEKSRFSIVTVSHKININRPLIMGVLNLTPDSFSGDGILKEIISRDRKKSLIAERIEKIVEEGADIIDIGGESTRPGAKTVSVEEELHRVMPALEIIKKNFPQVPVSIDTYKPQVANAAISNGACIVNDITGLKNRQMAELVSKKKAGIVIMHMKGTPRTMQRSPAYSDVIKEVYDFLSNRVSKALNFGIPRNRVIIDVGIGFGKRAEDNLKLIKYLYQFRSLGVPILIGTSRKSFIGKVLKEKDPQKRLSGTVASLVASIINGAKIIRVHDVKAAKQAVNLTKAIFS